MKVCLFDFDLTAGGIYINNMNKFWEFLKNYWFTTYLVFTIIITISMIVQNDKNAYNFKKLSVDHMLTIKTNQDIKEMQKKLENMTHQPVIIEYIDEYKYRILLRCPPDKYDQISGWIRKKTNN